MDITKWSIQKSALLSSLQPKMEKVYTVRKTRPGTNCGSDHELLIEKLMLKLKKVEKTIRPFKYELPVENKLNPLWLYSEGNE